MRAFHAFFLLILTVYSAPPEIISATFQSHNAQVFGVDLGYTVIELESDQDLYYSGTIQYVSSHSPLLENQVCPCRNDSTACQGGTLPPIPQSPDIQLLEQNVWEKVTPILNYFDWFSLQADLLWGVERVYKFILEPSDNNPCPILELQANSIYGGVRYFVSNRAIPTAKRYIWTRVCSFVFFHEWLLTRHGNLKATGVLFWEHPWLIITIINSFIARYRGPSYLSKWSKLLFWRILHRVIGSNSIFSCFKILD